MAVSDLSALMGNLTFKLFEKNTHIPVECQQEILKKILRVNANTEYGKKYGFSDIRSIEEYQDRVPLTTYKDYEQYVDRMLAGEKNVIMASKVNRYASSSGSVGKPKILPKTWWDVFNMQGTGMCSPMACAKRHLESQGRKMPKLWGPLVLSLTGHPVGVDKMRCNGAGQIPLDNVKSFFKGFCTSPVEILYAEDEEKLNIPYLHLRFALQDENVTFLGSIVITLLTTMFEYLEDNWQLLCDDIEKGTIDPSVKITPDLREKFEKRLKPRPERAAQLRKEFEKGFDTPIAPRIWPQLVWAYGMVGSNLAIYVKKLRKYIGDDIPLHNMGYAAAEGFFAMPVEMDVDDYVLLPKLLFFEFLPVDAPEGTRPLLIQDLEVGKRYELIVSNNDGLYRYNVEDVIEVTGMYNKTPKIRFLYRNNLSMNIANEKTTTDMVDWAAAKVSEATGVDFRGHSFYANYETNPPHYVMFAEPETVVPEERNAEFVQLLDDALREANEKYFKYRRWGMLSEPEVIFLKHGTYIGYNEYLRSQGVVLNQIKPVTVINKQERKDYFFSQAEGGRLPIGVTIVDGHVVDHGEGSAFKMATPDDVSAPPEEAPAEE